MVNRRNVSCQTRDYDDDIYILYYMTIYIWLFYLVYLNDIQLIIILCSFEPGSTSFYLNRNLTNKTCHVGCIIIIKSLLLFSKYVIHLRAIIKLPACLTLLTLETYNLFFIASKLLTVADMLAIWFPPPANSLVKQKRIKSKWPRKTSFLLVKNYWWWYLG